MSKVYPITIKSNDSQQVLFFTVVIASDFEMACDIARDEFLQTLTFEQHTSDFRKLPKKRKIVEELPTHAGLKFYKNT